MRHIQVKSYDDYFFRSRIIIQPKAPTNAILFADELRKKTREFCTNIFENLDKYPYLYFTSGITEAIDYLVTKQITGAATDEYRYVFAHNTVKPKLDVETLYFTYPNSSTGQFRPIPKNNKIILDCAYIMASNMMCTKVIPDNVEYVLFGPSKSHNLSDLRCGWFFSKHLIKSFHLAQYEFGYVNSIHHAIIDVIRDYKPNFLYSKYKEELSRLYQQHNLIEGDTNLFGLKNNQKIPYWTL